MKKEKYHWFLVEEKLKVEENKELKITDSKLLHQFNRVLKFKPGELLVVFDGKGRYLKCEIEDLQKRGCVLNVLEDTTKHENGTKLINLYFGIPKKSKFEVILEKGTEVGVMSFNPLKTKRTEKNNVKMERAKKILVEASEQSENPILPLLRDVQDLEDVLQSLNLNNTFVFHTGGKQLSLEESTLYNEVNILIGPEGGWSQDEIQLFKDGGFSLYKVGESVLKTETACIVIPFLFGFNN
jgi:16S rRNA (uracil1498-N3)-methyltransferase